MIRSAPGEKGTIKEASGKSFSQFVFEMVSRTLAFFSFLVAVVAFERFIPPANTDVKHICVDNPDLPACGPDFCKKNPDAAGCKKYDGTPEYFSRFRIPDLGTSLKTSSAI